MTKASNVWMHARRASRRASAAAEMALDAPGEGGGRDDEAVDDDEPETRFEFKQRNPFQREVEKALVKFVTEKFKVFVSELSAKGSTQPKAGFAAKTETRVQVGQYQKYEQGPDGVAALQETAKKYSDKMNSEARQED